MDIKQLNVVTFSPTHSTKRIALNIVSGLDLKRVPTTLIDITTTAKRKETYKLEKTELLLAAAPSYGGRIPQVDPPAFENLEGDRTPAILFVTFGVKGYDNALHELNSILAPRGFVCFAAAAFATAHTFSQVVGAGRPNADDFHRAKEFGGRAREKLQNGDFSTPGLPGGEPYPDFPAFPYAGPETDETCTMCNACHRWCPTDAIPSYAPNQTDADKCIRCLSCVKRCPIGARAMKDPVFIEKVAGFDKAFANKQSEPEFFL